MSLPSFGVNRPVPVNILTVAILVAGAVALASITREFFPETTPESATVRLPYPGATPEEIEDSLARKVEDKLADLDEVERLTTTLSEGSGLIFVEFREGVNVTRGTDEVERVIATLTDLPEESERIEVAEFEPRLPVIRLSVFGEADEDALKRTIFAVRDELQTLPGMGEIQLSGVRDYEIRVDLSAEALVRFGVSLPQVADIIDAWMRDVPGGTVRTPSRNVNVRAIGVEERADAIREIVLRAAPDGRVLRLGEIAEVDETFVDEPFRSRFRTPHIGGRASSLTVYKVGDQDAVDIARMVREYARGRRMAAGDESAVFEPRWPDRLLALLGPFTSGSEPPKSKRRQAYELGLESPVPLPPGCSVETSSDLARFIEGRLDLLRRNAISGALLVMGSLLLFLNWRTAFWVGAGLVAAVAGTLVVMALAGITLNLLSMFGLIIVLGLQVDDAIVVSENIQARHDGGEPALVAAIRGTEQVQWPVVATVLTTVFAFTPLLFVSGEVGALLRVLPMVVVCALLMSLVESLLILPSHLAHSLVHRDRAREGRAPSVLMRLERARDRIIFGGVVPLYAQFVGWSLEYRWVSLSASLAVLMVCAGLVAGGRVEFTFIPSSDSETLIADVRMPVGSAIEATEAVVRRIENAAAAQPETSSITTIVGARADVGDVTGITNGGEGTHLGQLFIELVPTESRDRESSAVTASIREALGRVDEVESLGFSEIQGGPAGKDITLQVLGDDRSAAQAAAAEVGALLRSIDGLFDVADDDEVGQREVQITLRPSAAALGFTLADVARQVRGSLFGLDAHVFAVDREEIDVRVRLDEATRRSLRSVENIWLISPAGRAVPLGEIADLEEGASDKTIRRVDRRRAITISADAAPGVSPESIMASIGSDLIDIDNRFPTVEIESTGRQRQLRQAFSSLPFGFAAALVLIYVNLAWLFGSYTQPLAVMLAIPFGTAGVVLGHLLMGYDLTFMSVIGFVALSGIVVNDSLILVEFYNSERKQGVPLREALVSAGRHRLRPIFLTTIGNVLGLMPLMLEQSFQAKFLIPMAISISFGLISSTVLVLLVLPCILVIIDDVQGAASFLWNGRRRPGPTSEAEPGSLHEAG